jgi:hypothetical protein
LDSAFELWHLVAESDDNNPVRFWESRGSAISELEGEGWILVGPFPRRHRRRWRLNRTYSLVRSIQ